MLKGKYMQLKTKSRVAMSYFTSSKLNKVWADKGCWRKGQSVTATRAFPKYGTLRNTQNYWIGNRTLRASLCCSCDPSLLDKIWFSSAEWVQTALMLGQKLIISKWKVLSALGVNVCHSRLGTKEDVDSPSFCLITGEENSFYTKDTRLVSGNLIKCESIDKQANITVLIVQLQKFFWA